MNKTLFDKASIFLKSCGLRKTRPRQVILWVLLEADHPLTQEQIAERIGKTAPNKTTIYRCLMKLVSYNLIHLAYIKDRTQYFETAHHCRTDQCHPHFTCIDCGQTHCFHDTVIPALQNVPPGFLVQHRTIRLEGICADCQLTKRIEDRDILSPISK